MLASRRSKSPGGSQGGMELGGFPESKTLVVSLAGGWKGAGLGACIQIWPPGVL